MQMPHNVQPSPKYIIFCQKCEWDGIADILQRKKLQEKEIAEMLAHGNEKISATAVVGNKANLTFHMKQEPFFILSRERMSEVLQRKEITPYHMVHHS